MFLFMYVFIYLFTYLRLKTEGKKDMSSPPFCIENFNTNAWREFSRHVLEWILMHFNTQVGVQIKKYDNLGR